MLRPTSLKLGALILVLTAGLPARADFVNPSFEVPTVLPGGFQQLLGGSSALNGWTVVGSDVMLIQTSYSEPGNGLGAFNAQNGLNALDLTGVGNTGSANGVQQALATTVGQLYELSFYVGRAGGSGNSGYQGPATIDVSIDGGARLSFTNTDLTDRLINWKLFTTTFTATSANTTITFLNGTPTTVGYAGLDNVSLAAVPEPTSIALLGCGLATFFVVVWRRGRRDRLV